MDTSTSQSARGFAAAVALAAAIGLVIQFDVALTRTAASVAETLWSLLRYFTILTNILVACVFGRIAAIPLPLRPPWVLPGTVYMIGLVGVIYVLLLQGLVELHGADQVANALLHYLTPVMAVAYWLACAPKGTLRYQDPFLWATVPALYVAYALIRGAVDGHYPYPFLNVTAHGGAAVMVNCVAIGIGFFAVAFLGIWLDRRLYAATAGKRHDRSI